MDLAVDAFYASGGAAGRREGFITSPEVGPLFGAVVARALDEGWRERGEPDPFVVVEDGAGRGALALAVRAAAPACSVAMTYVLVERSPALRARHGEHLSLAGAGPGPRFVSAAGLPPSGARGAVVANELLDNLPVKLVEWSPAGWAEVRVDVAEDGSFVERLVPASSALAEEAARWVPSPGPGARLPGPEAARRWLARAGETLAEGRGVVPGYGDAWPALRAQAGWGRAAAAPAPGA